ncbi:ammonia channel protein [Sphingobacteriales bacterium UPWRP_1]|nr:ammonia channel protein [Sphingobacteriales bacterium UPWRP_1]
MTGKRRAALPFWLLIGVNILAVVSLATGTDAVQPVATYNIGDTAWLLTATGLVLLMTPGLAFFYGGMINAKNVISTMLQSFVAMSVVSLVWVMVGFSLAFGDSVGGIIGSPFSYFMFNKVLAGAPWTLAPTIPLALFAMFQLKFAIITPALITGAFAERIRFTAYVLFVVLFSIFIYAPVAHWTWHPQGFLFKLGVLDFAGGTVVHIVAGCAALASALFLRKQNKNETETHLPANIPYVLLGTGLLWFGWFGFNAGSAMGANALAVTAFATTNTASASAALGWLLVDVTKGRKPSALGFCIGAVVGLVAITPAAGFVSIPAAIIIGTVAAVISNAVVDWRSRTSLDDTLDVFPCHGVGGMVGMVMTALFASAKINSAVTTEGVLLGGGFSLLWQHLAGLVVVILYSFLGTLLLLIITNLIIPLRVSSMEEQTGLDLTQHDESIAAGLHAQMDKQ